MGTATAAHGGAHLSRRSTVLEWLTTTDHKKIGVMYMVTSFAFFMFGGVLALGIRTELAVPGLQFLSQDVYNQLFGMHAIMMIFLFVMPMTTGLANYIVPLQLGAADMSFPRINALSYWMLIVGAILIVSAFFFGGAPTGWTLYVPLAGNTDFTPETGVDLLLLGLVVLGFSSIFGAINFIVTIFKMRAPGHGPHAHADVLLDIAGDLGPAALQPAGHRCRPDHDLHRPQLRWWLLRSGPRAAAPCCGSTSSGSSATRRCTS